MKIVKFVDMDAQDLRIWDYYKAAIDFIGSASARLLMNDSREFEMTKEKLILLLQLGLESFIHPIPLTAEWLEKFGFENNYDNVPTLCIGKNRLQWSANELLWQQNPHNDWSVFECKYVHQLQNLYFALTGEELTISQKTVNIES